MGQRNKIELRFSEIDPPARDPRKTVYMDIEGMASPLKFGLTIRYFNYDDVTLYFQITGSGIGYTFGTVNLGSLTSGANAYKNLDDFFERAKPSVGDLPGGEKQEIVTLTLRGYTDAGYSNLKWTYSRSVTVYFINSDDAAFTKDLNNNFDDGTLQGWAGKALENDNGDPITTEVAIDYTITPPYSARITEGPYNAIISGETFGVQYGGLRRDGIELIWLGIPLVYAPTPDQFPIDKWLRMVTVLPKNTLMEIRIHAFTLLKWALGGRYFHPCLYKSVTTANRNKVFLIVNFRNTHWRSNNNFYVRLWCDDIKIVSKD